MADIWRSWSSAFWSTFHKPLLEMRASPGDPLLGQLLTVIKAFLIDIGQAYGREWIALFFVWSAFCVISLNFRLFVMD